MSAVQFALLLCGMVLTSAGAFGNYACGLNRFSPRDDRMWLCLSLVCDLGVGTGAAICFIAGMTP